jgi:hypothetical protein
MGDHVMCKKLFLAVRTARWTEIFNFIPQDWSDCPHLFLLELENRRSVSQMESTAATS